MSTHIHAQDGISYSVEIDRSVKDRPVLYFKILELDGKETEAPMFATFDFGWTKELLEPQRQQ